MDDEIDRMINDIQITNPTKEMEMTKQKLIAYRQTFSLTLTHPLPTWGPCKIVINVDQTVSEWMEMGGEPIITDIQHHDYPDPDMIRLITKYPGVKLELYCCDGLSCVGIEKVWVDRLKIANLYDPIWFTIPCREMVIYNCHVTPEAPNTHVEVLKLVDVNGWQYMSDIQYHFPNLLSFEIGEWLLVIFDCPVTIPTIKGNLSYKEYLELVKVSSEIENIDIAVICCSSSGIPSFPEPKSKFYKVKFINDSKKLCKLTKGNPQTLTKIVSTYYFIATPLYHNIQLWY
jgi:hypothetical protein